MHNRDGCKIIISDEGTWHPDEREGFFPWEGGDEHGEMVHDIVATLTGDMDNIYSNFSKIYQIEQAAHAYGLDKEPLIFTCSMSTGPSPLSHYETGSTVEIFVEKW